LSKCKLKFPEVTADA